jgi:1-acyl-sn-glycerol-3-phosphate acyltransferase
MVLGARARLACLWLSQVGRVMADQCLRIFVVLQTAAAGVGQRDAAWHLVVALWVLPAIVLGPANGAISNSLPKRRVLAGSALFGLVVVALFALAGGGWLACLALVAVASALYSPTRYALLPAAAHDCRLPLARVNGWIEMGTASAIVAGMVLGGYVSGYRGPELDDRQVPPPAAVAGMPPAVAATLALSLVGWLAALPVAFPADVRRPESPLAALAGFFRDTRRICQLPQARGPLLGLAGFRGLVAAVTGAAIATALGQTAESGADDPFTALLQVALWIMAGGAVGSLLAGIQGHPRRALGLVPIGATGLALTLAWAAGHTLPWWLCATVGVLGGLINVPLNAAYQGNLPADARGNGLAVLNTAGYLAMTTMSLTLAGLARFQVVTPAGQMALVAGLATVGAAIAWCICFRDTFEQFLEFVFWPIHRARGYGPGLESIPQHGPVLILANHSCWFDPLFLAKVLPRRLFPMMTSQFYDLPVLHWFMVHVFHAIRVASSTYRREAPELLEAIGHLDRGHCVVIFPEGMLRRSTERPLRQFGQGVWHILRERPTVPLVACWIEGGWGSFASYFGGPPTVNKRMDFWRKIDVGVSDPIFLDAALLADQRGTRAYLMRACLEARRHLGLEPLAAPEPIEVSALAGDEDDANGY